MARQIRAQSGQRIGVYLHSLFPHSHDSEGGSRQIEREEGHKVASDLVFDFFGDQGDCGREQIEMERAECQSSRPFGQLEGFSALP